MPLRGAQPAPAGLFTMPGAGTLTRTVDAKLTDMPSVFDWNGVKGNGVYDDSAGINAALAAMKASGGGILHFPKPPVKFHCASPLGVSGLSSTTLWGSSKASIIEFAVAGGSGLDASLWANCAITGLRFTGVAGQNGQIILLDTCTDTKVSDCFVSGQFAVPTASFPAAILVNSCTDCAVEDVHCFGNGLGSDAVHASSDILMNLSLRCTVKRSNTTSTLVMIGIGCQDSSWVGVEDCYVSGPLTNPAHDTYGYGIMFYGHAGATPMLASRILRCQVENVAGNGVYLQTAVDCEVGSIRLKNVCTDIHTGGIAEGGIGANNLSSDLDIHDIDIDTCGRAGIRTDAARTRIAGANIKNCAFAAVGFGDVAADSEVTGVTSSACASGAILPLFPALGILRLNVHDNNGTGIGTTDDGIAFDSVHDSKFTNNTMLGFGNVAYQVLGNDNYRRGNRGNTGAQQGTAVLVGGTIAIVTNEVLAGDVVNVARTIAGGALGHLSVAVIAGTITITSSSGTDTSTVAWEIVH